VTENFFILMNGIKNSSLNFPTVLIYSGLDDLSFSLCKKVLKKNCRVRIFSTDKKSWRLALNQEQLRNTKISSVSFGEEVPSPSYIIYLLNRYKLADKKSSKFQKQEARIVSSVINLAKKSKTKALFLLPLHEKTKDLLSDLYEKLGKDFLKSAEANVILLGQTLGLYHLPSEQDVFDTMTREALRGDAVNVPTGEAPLSSSDSTAEAVLKILFSFGGPQEISIVGPEISFPNYFQKLLLLNPKLIARETQNTYLESPALGQKIVVAPPNDEELLEAFEPLVKRAQLGKGRLKFFKKTKRALAYFLFSLLLIFVLPYLVLLSGIGFLFGAAVLAQNQRLEEAQRLVILSQKVAMTSKSGFSTLTRVPLAHGFFRVGLSASDILTRGAEIGKHSLLIFRRSQGVAETLLSDTYQEEKPAPEDIFLELDYIYRELGFLQGEIGGLGEKLPSWVNLDGLLATISGVKEKVYWAGEVASEASWILGDDSKRVYLVLLQNNMELRPTGGYIGSFALVSVEGGKLIDFEVQDVFSADGQLKGHVEPPLPIKKYLGEAGWFLRDSNWDPEFSVSAQRAEWFLDKEIGVSVDGVIGVDLEAVKKLLDVTGEIELVDFSKKISSKNLFEETRSQIEENFFPGSIRKASFLTALSSSLLNKLSESGNANRFQLGKAVISGLEERNIQIFLHNARALRAIEGLGWEGGLPDNSCTAPCLGDWLGIAEANLGVNKTNYFIQRKVELSVTLEPNQVKRNLTIIWKNTAPEELGEEGRYEAYVRVLVPKGVVFGGGQKRIDKSIVTFSPDQDIVRAHQEAGTIIEVFPGESASLSFNWISPAPWNSEEGEYKLTIRKQAGTAADPWDIRIENILGKAILQDPSFGLTGPAEFGYNTFLARDFVSRVYW